MSTLGLKSIQNTSIQKKYLVLYPTQLIYSYREYLYGGGSLLTKTRRVRFGREGRESGAVGRGGTSAS